MAAANRRQRPGAGSARRVSRRDAEVERTLGLENPLLNTLTYRFGPTPATSATFVHFVRTHPGTMLRKWWEAYHVFWQPIANYGHISSASSP